MRNAVVVLGWFSQNSIQCTTKLRENPRTVWLAFFFSGLYEWTMNFTITHVSLGCTQWRKCWLSLMLQTEDESRFSCSWWKAQLLLLLLLFFLITHLFFSLSLLRHNLKVYVFPLKESQMELFKALLREEPMHWPTLLDLRRKGQRAATWLLKSDWPFNSPQCSVHRL